MAKRSVTYSKLLPSGLLDNSPISQSDYDVVLQYIKKSFPKANTVQRDVEQTLKRTFVLGGGSSSSSKANKTFRISKKNQTNVAETKVKGKNSKRSAIKPVPQRLPYERFETLHQMWKEYVAELLRDTDKNRIEGIQQKLNKVDLHGAHVQVTHSNCKDFIGLKGIIIKETRNTFVIVTKDNVTKTIPKPEGEFQIELLLGEPQQGSIIIAGNSFLTRPAERASKKVKSFMEFTGTRVYRNTLRYSKPT